MTNNFVTNKAYEGKKPRHSAASIGSVGAFAFLITACADEARKSYGIKLDSNSVNALAEDLPAYIDTPSGAQGIKVFGENDNRLAVMQKGGKVFFVPDGGDEYRLQYTLPEDQANVKEVIVHQSDAEQYLDSLDLSVGFDDNSVSTYLPSGYEAVFMHLNLPQGIEKTYTVRVHLDSKDGYGDANLLLRAYDSNSTLNSNSYQHFITVDDYSTPSKYFFQGSSEAGGTYRVIYYEDKYGDFPNNAEGLSQGGQEKIGAINVAIDQDWFSLGTLDTGKNYIFTIDDYEGDVAFLNRDYGNIVFSSFETWEDAGIRYFVVATDEDETSPAYMVLRLDNPGNPPTALPSYAINWVDDDYSPIPSRGSGSGSGGGSGSGSFLPQDKFQTTEQPTSVSGNLEKSGDQDLIKIELEANTDYLLQLSGHKSVLGISADAASRATDPFEENGRYRFTTGTATTYYLLIEDYDQEAGETGSYTVSFSKDDYFGDKDTLSTISTSSTVDGTINSGSDKDWFHIDLNGATAGSGLTAGTSYRVTATGANGSDLISSIAVRDRNGKIISGEKKEGASVELSFIVPAANSDYYIEILGASARTGDYTLKLEELNPSSSDSAPTLTSGLKSSESGASASRFYVYDFSENKANIIHTSGVGGGIDLSLNEQAVTDGLTAINSYATGAYLFEPAEGEGGNYGIELKSVASNYSLTVASIAGFYHGAGTEALSGYSASATTGQNLNSMIFKHGSEISLVSKENLRDFPAINFATPPADFNDGITKITGLTVAKAIAGYDIDQTGTTKKSDLMLIAGTNAYMLRGSLLSQDSINASQYSAAGNNVNYENFITFSGVSGVTVAEVFDNPSGYQDMAFLSGGNLTIVSAASMFGNKGIWENSNNEFSAPVAVNITNLANGSHDLALTVKKSGSTSSTTETIGVQAANFSAVTENGYAFVNVDDDTGKDLVLLQNTKAYVLFSEYIASGSANTIDNAYVTTAVSGPSAESKYKGFVLNGATMNGKLYAGKIDTDNNDDLAFAAAGSIHLVYGDKLKNSDWHGSNDKNLTNIGRVGADEYDLGVILESSATGFGGGMIDFGNINEGGHGDMVVELNTKLWVIYGEKLQEEADNYNRKFTIDDDWVKEHGVVVDNYAKSTMDFFTFDGGSDAGGGGLVINKGSGNTVRLNQDTFHSTGELDLADLSFTPFYDDL